MQNTTWLFVFAYSRISLKGTKLLGWEEKTFYYEQMSKEEDSSSSPQVLKKLHLNRFIFKPYEFWHLDSGFQQPLPNGANYRRHKIFNLQHPFLSNNFLSIFFQEGVSFRHNLHHRQHMSSNTYFVWAINSFSCLTPRQSISSGSCIRGR